MPCKQYQLPQFKSYGSLGIVVKAYKEKDYRYWIELYYFSSLIFRDSYVSDSSCYQKFYRIVERLNDIELFQGFGLFEFARRLGKNEVNGIINKALIGRE